MSRGIVELALSDVFSVLYVRRVYRRTCGSLVSSRPVCTREPVSKQNAGNSLIGLERCLYVEASKVHFEEDRPRLGNSGKARSHEI